MFTKESATGAEPSRRVTRMEVRRLQCVSPNGSARTSPLGSFRCKPFNGQSSFLYGLRCDFSTLLPPRKYKNRGRTWTGTPLHQRHWSPCCGRQCDPSPSSEEPLISVFLSGLLVCTAGIIPGQVYNLWDGLKNPISLNSLNVIPYMLGLRSPALFLSFLSRCQ